MTYNQVKGSAEYIMAQTRIRPKVAIILGNGMNPVLNDMESVTRIPYKNIPRWNGTQMGNQEGTLIIGTLGKIPVAVMSGRLHYYDGNSMAECGYPVAVLKALGVTKIIITNISGAINEQYQPGDMVLIEDHIKFFNESPLRGEDAAMFGTGKFFDMSDTYSRDLRNRLKEAFKAETKIDLKSGVYAYMPGPQFETPAEIRMLRVLGADMVGMSTVPEAIMAAACHMKVLGISVMSNMAAGVLDQPLTDEECEKVFAKVQDNYGKLLRTAIETVGEE